MSGNLERLTEEQYTVMTQKYSGKSNRINWDSLKQLGKNNKLLECLENSYDRLSGGKTHRGLEELENSLQEYELREIIDDIEKNINNS